MYPAPIGPLIAEARRVQRARRYDEALDWFGKPWPWTPDHLEALGNRGGVFGRHGPL